MVRKWFRRKLVFFVFFFYLVSFVSSGSGVVSSTPSGVVLGIGR